MAKNKFSNEVTIFKAFSDVKRLQILAILKTGEKCANKILEDMDIVQSTLSHHMKILCTSGVVTARRDEKWTYYSISEKGLKHVRSLLQKITEVV